MYKWILLDVKDRIATLTLNHPTQGNAVPSDGYLEIVDAMNRCDKDDDVAVVVLTGAGKHFSAGGNIRKFQESIDSKAYLKEDIVRDTAKIVLSLRQCGKPTVAMVNGAAAGLGFGLALSCDFRIVTAKSKFVAAFSNIGLTGDTGIMFMLQRMVGLAKATELMMLGQPVPGEEALALGLANRLAPEGELEQVTLEFAKTLAARPLMALRYQKQLYYETFMRGYMDYAYREAQYMREASMTEDFAEAVSAFLAKRPPEFKGR
ncbi:MAG: enoyl-CoA hydratase/isomerase family protein [Oscillospiraceae bacterium]